MRGSRWWSRGITAFSFAAACATPFAALAAVAALTLSRGDAYRIAVAVWLADQIVGYAIHGYPRTLESVAWGATIGAAALLATWAARAAATGLRATAPLARALCPPCSRLLPSRSGPLRGGGVGARRHGELLPRRS